MLLLTVAGGVALFAHANEQQHETVQDSSGVKPTSLWERKEFFSSGVLPCSAPVPVEADG